MANIAHRFPPEWSVEEPAACLVQYVAHPRASLRTSGPGNSPDLSGAVILSTRNSFVCLDTSVKECPQSSRDQMKKVGLAVWRTSNGLPSASDPETEADRTPRESLVGVHDRQSVSQV